MKDDRKKIINIIIEEIKLCFDDLNNPYIDDRKASYNKSKLKSLLTKWQSSLINEAVDQKMWGIKQRSEEDDLSDVDIEEKELDDEEGDEDEEDSDEQS
jgi:hypothetical protein